MGDNKVDYFAPIFSRLVLDPLSATAHVSIDQNTQIAMDLPKVI